MPIENQFSEKAAKWFAAREWANGLRLDIHKSVNVNEFYSQFNRNRIYWEKALAYLRDTDLDTVAPGKYYLDDKIVFAIVSENNPKEIDNVKWEAHRNYIDIQYVIKGKEKMGIAPLEGSASESPFNIADDIGFYNITETNARYFVASPGTMFIFFPQDAHRPCIKTDEINSDKKVVIKIKVG